MPQIGIATIRVKTIYAIIFAVRLFNNGTKLLTFIFLLTSDPKDVSISIVIPITNTAVTTDII